MTRETVDRLIARVMAQHPGHGTPKLQLEYFEAVHQELAPLARELEAENQRLHAQMQSDWTGSRKRVLAEREACAALAEAYTTDLTHCKASAHAADMTAVAIGRAIRARSTKP